MNELAQVLAIMALIDYYENKLRTVGEPIPGDQYRKYIAAGVKKLHNLARVATA